MNRSAIRELAFRLIYSHEIQKEENLEEQIELFIKANSIEDKNAIEYINDAIKRIAKNNKLKTRLKKEKIKKE